MSHATHLIFGALASGDPCGAQLPGNALADIPYMPQRTDRNRQGRFLPGNSGNPGGRPRGGVSVSAAMRTLSSQPVPKEHGGKARETWASCIARMIFERAAAGDLRAAALVLDRLDGRSAVPLPDEDQIIVIERLPPTFAPA